MIFVIFPAYNEERVIEPTLLALARISRAPCKGTVFQRVRTPPGNFRSSR